MPRAKLTLLLAPALAPLLLAASDTQLQPGLWEIVNTPGVATLDGRELDDLPLGPIKTQQVCLPAAELADPARFFARDTAADCRIVSSSLAAGQVSIVGACPNPEEGNEARSSSKAATNPPATNSTSPPAPRTSRAS
jgi:hypothetical protein